MSYSSIPVLTAPTRDTHANWTANNPVLPKGVMGIVKDRLGEGSLEFVIGDGETAYNDLPKSGEQVGSSYELPVATASTLGGVKVGDGLEITTDGTLSATRQGGDYLILTAVPSASDLSDGEVAFVVEA